MIEQKLLQPELKTELKFGQRIRKMIDYRLWYFIFCATLWGIMHAVPVLTGYFIKLIFDALAANNIDLAWLALLVFSLIDLSRMGVLFVAEFVYIDYWLELKSLLQRNMLDYLMNAPFSRPMTDSSSEAVSRFRDDTDTVNQVIENWTDFFGMAIYMVAACIIMFSISPVMTGLMLVPMVAILLATRLFMPYVRNLRRKSRAATEAVTGFIGELFNSVQAVKIARKESSMLTHFECLNKTRQSAALKDVMVYELLGSVNRNMVNIGTAIVLFFAASQMQDGQFTVGDFALFMAYMPRLSWRMGFIGDMMANYKRGSVSFERMDKLLHDAPDEQIVRPEQVVFERSKRPKIENPLLKEVVELEPDGFSPINRAKESIVADTLNTLSIQGLSYSYPEGGANAFGIQDISFDIKQGEFIVITGKVGSGKTTLLKALLGILLKDSGKVFWNGQEVLDSASFFVPPRSAYTAQVPRLFSDSLRNNILLGQPEERLEKAIDTAILGHDVARLEKGLDSLVGTRGVKLSGGQIQRTAAARMFAQQSELMVFDDLSSALDVRTEAQLWQKIFSQDDRQGRANGQDKAKVTCLVVSHRQSVLEQADQVLVMEGGRLQSSN